MASGVPAYLLMFASEAAFRAGDAPLMDGIEARRIETVPGERVYVPEADVVIPDGAYIVITDGSEQFKSNPQTGEDCLVDVIVHFASASNAHQLSPWQIHSGGAFLDDVMQFNGTNWTPQKNPANKLEGRLTYIEKLVYQLQQQAGENGGIGSSYERPNNPPLGTRYYDTGIGKLLICTASDVGYGAEWRDAFGNIVVYGGFREAYSPPWFWVQLKLNTYQVSSDADMPTLECRETADGPVVMSFVASNYKDGTTTYRSSDNTPHNIRHITVIPKENAPVGNVSINVGQDGVNWHTYVTRSSGSYEGETTPFEIPLNY